MSNNNNNNSTSPTGPTPKRPPDPPGLTATKSYSAAVGATPPAKAATVIATVIATSPPAVAAPRSHPLMHDIANCVIVKTPPGSTPEQVLTALDKQFPSLTGAMPCLIKGQRGLRFPKEADLRELVARGLTVGKTLCKIDDLFHIAQKSVIQCTLVGFFSDPEGVRLFDEKIKEFETVLMRRTQYVGKTKHISGVYDFVLALKDPNVLPHTSLPLERDGVTERIPLRITGGMRHCVFCRSGAHVRKDCTVAPPCKICTKTSHATQHCPGRHGSSPQAASTSRASQAPAAAAAAGSNTASATVASDRKTKRRRTENILAPQPDFQSNDASPMPISRTFTFTPQAAPQLAPIQGTASLVEKSSESSSSETTSPSPSPPPATPKTIMTRSKSILAPANAPETSPAALQATEPTSKPSSPKPTPSAAPKARPDDADAADDADEGAKDQGAPPKDIPNVSFVAANVQSINEDRRRASLFSNLRAHNADIFLLSETGRPPPERVAQWTQECQDSKLSALFTPFNNTAILWKSDSPVVTIDPESPSNFLRASFSFPDRISDATFRVGDSKVRVVSIYAPSSDQPDKKRFLSHISTTLRRAMRDDPSPPAHWERLQLC
ncbi:BQ2448_2399 [Microbotryum intermedium]|uniref:BQ2448_2399 protein n=1 Tax=Microbotryum intermedium TaxID=269621 RepID=A0A238F9E7_9BASI|nr:BQ2448_2399 [Microbotryum intermedium]